MKISIIIITLIKLIREAASHNQINDISQIMTCFKLMTFLKLIREPDLFTTSRAQTQLTKMKRVLNVMLPRL